MTGRSIAYEPLLNSYGVYLTFTRIIVNLLFANHYNGTV